MSNLFIDNFSSIAAQHHTWIVLYLMLAFLIIKNNKTFLQILFIFTCGIAGVALSYIYSYDETFKFSLAAYFALLIRSRSLSTTLFVWAIVGCLCKVNLGYVTTVEALIGGTWGILTGSVIYLIYHYVMKRVSPYGRYVSTHYTSTGYDHRDIDATISIVMLTAVYIILHTLL